MSYFCCSMVAGPGAWGKYAYEHTKELPTVEVGVDHLIKLYKEHEKYRSPDWLGCIGGHVHSKWKDGKVFVYQKTPDSWWPDYVFNVMCIYDLATEELHWLEKVHIVPHVPKTT